MHSSILLYHLILLLNNTGNQPEGGTMKHIVTQHRLPGFKQDSTGTIQINYHFPNGIQDVSFLLIK